MGRAHYKPVIEYCGGTEIGGAFVSGSLLQPQSLSSFSTPAMGCTLLILGSDGNPLVSVLDLHGVLVLAGRLQSSHAMPKLRFTGLSRSYPLIISAFFS